LPNNAYSDEISLGVGWESVAEVDASILMVLKSGEVHDNITF